MNTDTFYWISKQCDTEMAIKVRKILLISKSYILWRHNSRAWLRLHPPLFLTPLIIAVHCWVRTWPEGGNHFLKTKTAHRLKVPFPPMINGRHLETYTKLSNTYIVWTDIKKHSVKTNIVRSDIKEGWKITYFGLMSRNTDRSISSETDRGNYGGSIQAKFSPHLVRSINNNITNINDSYRMCWGKCCGFLANCQFSRTC